MRMHDAGRGDGTIRRLGAAAAVALLAVAGSADAGRHTVRPGETLGDIARDHDASVAGIVSANGLTDADHIVAGVTLAIPGDGGSHTVQPGENLATIAARYGTTVSSLASANGIADRNLIRIGQRLSIPAGGGGAGPVSHTVRPGENLATIAARYGTTVSSLASANGIADRNLIRIGQRLSIPAGGGGTTTSGGGGAQAPSGSAGTHIVAAGETLASIAARYGVGVAELAAANGIVEPFTVYGGTRLALGGGGSAGTMARCPLPGASFFNDWGFPRSGGRFHEGNDLFASRGTPVLAPVSGTASHTSGRIGGLQFRLVADDGTLYLGSHLDAFGAAGRVAAGDVVGYVGDTGNARGSRPHVHFEIHPDGGAAVNPYPAVVSACR